MPVYVNQLFYMLVFPGFAFLAFFALAAEYVDRKLHAKLQQRIGPPWFQPLADIIKLAAKEDLMPESADRWMFKLTPLVALASTVTAFIYIPVWSRQAPLAFEGDVIVVLYLLTIPTFTFFLGGWYSRSVFSMIGAARTLTQLFAYEIPLFISILSAALLAGMPVAGAPKDIFHFNWSLSGMSAFYHDHPAFAACNAIGFFVALIALLGKLERVPFDIPDAETEIGAGTFTEYSGRLLALFRLTISIEMIVGASLLAAVFIPFGLDFGPAAGFVFYVLKVLFVVCLLSVARTIFARLRIDQMINFCWKVAAPIAFVQLLLNLAVKGLL
jgi:NADH-quinone oxidoreductase subunit H